MPQAETLRVIGYREFMRATARADRESKKYIRDAFKEVGESVRADAQRRMTEYDSRSAAGYRVSVRQRGIVVRQSLRKTTGDRPDYGSLQMRKALLPALMTNGDELNRDLELALARVAQHFEAKP